MEHPAICGRFRGRIILIWMLKAEADESQSIFVAWRARYGVYDQAHCGSVRSCAAARLVRLHFYYRYPHPARARRCAWLRHVLSENTGDVKGGFCHPRWRS
jgi:hypothetical protein